MAASGSSPLTWKMGAWTPRATSVEYGVERDSSGQRGEADLVVDDEVDRAAGGVAVELREVQRLGDHALSGERRVAVDQDRDDALALRCRRGGPAWRGRCLRRPDRPLPGGSDWARPRR